MDRDAIALEALKLMTGSEHCPEANDLAYEIADIALAERKATGIIGTIRRPMTMQQVGELLGVTREYVKQVEHKALAKLRRSGKLEQFFLESLYATGQEW